MPIFRHDFFGTVPLSNKKQSTARRNALAVSAAEPISGRWNVHGMRIAILPGMLKITAQREAGVLRVELAGRLAGPWVEELEHCWRSTAGPQQNDPVRVDLTSVSFIDTAGKELLKAMHRDGVELVATGCLNRCIVETITRSGREEET